MQKQHIIEAIRQQNCFDDSFYFDQLVAIGPSAFQGDRTLIEHYLEIGFEQGLRPHPDFEEARYLREYAEALTKDPLANSVVDRARAAPGSPAESAVKALAFYLPQFHPIPENDLWWGKGFSEWTNVAQARPLFPGHNQPRVPADLGFYDLRLPEVRKAQAELARSYGIYGFCYYYYWFAGKRLLERPLDEMLCSGEPDFPFCLCWANENWSRRWDGGDSDILIAQEHTPENDLAFSESLIPYFQDRRYVRVQGRPMFIVYRPDALPDLKGTLVRWREHFRRRSIGEVYIVAALTFGFDQGIEAGFDAEVQFPPHSVYVPERSQEYQVASDFAGSIFRYADVVEKHVSHRAPGKTRFFTVMLEWDNSARKKEAGHIFDRFTLEEYELWLRGSVAKTQELYLPHEQFVFINAWNEWAEGTYLEPDRKRGLGYLEATKRGLQGLERAPLEVQIKMLEVFPPATQAAAETRMARLIELLPSDRPLPQSVTALLVPRKEVSVASIEYPVVDQTLAWIESICIDEPLSELGLHLSGWVISKTSPPAVVEVSIEDQLQLEMQVNTLRTDVYDYHKDFAEVILPNGFSSNLPLSRIMEYARWNTSPLVQVRVVGQDGTELSQIFIRLQVKDVKSSLASFASDRRLPIPGAQLLIQRFLRHAPVLFVMHDLYPAGAQLFLTQFLSWLKHGAPDLPFELLMMLRQSELPLYGDKAIALRHELESFTSMHWLDETTRLPTNLPQIEAGSYSLIYLNSIATLRNPYMANLLDSGTLLHVHELDFTVSCLLRQEQIERLRSSGAHAVACSKAVSEMLGERLGLPSDRVHLVHAFVPVASDGNEGSEDRSARGELDIPREAPIVLLVGSVTWRKGAYLLSGVARSLKEMRAGTEFPYFVWVGEKGEEHTLRQIEHEFELLGLRSYLRLVGRRDDVHRFYAAADVFLLTSIEDPFPLVMIEAGAAELPVVAFECSGGAAEFIAADGGGVTVPVLNTQQMAAVLHHLLADPVLRAQMGRKARDSAERFSLESTAPKLCELILWRRKSHADQLLQLD